MPEITTIMISFHTDVNTFKYLLEQVNIQILDCGRF